MINLKVAVSDNEKWDIGPHKYWEVGFTPDIVVMLETSSKVTLILILITSSSLRQLLSPRWYPPGGTHVPVPPPVPDLNR